MVSPLHNAQGRPFDSRLQVTDPLKDPADQPVEPDTPEPVPGHPTLG